jgi:methylated-DNA-[protein]-cysteine S-methyltransferase
MSENGETISLASAIVFLNQSPRQGRRFMPGPTESFELDHIASPIGTLLVAVDAEQRLRILGFGDHQARMQRLLRRQYRPGVVRLVQGRAPDSVRAPIEAFFAGQLQAIDAIPVKAAGTPFQRAVWAALRSIPAGETLSYGALARRIGRPAAVRAVGLANGANPIGVVVPCHRVIGADASLTGYGGGVERKRWLLGHEGLTFAGDGARARRQADAEAVLQS